MVFALLSRGGAGDWRRYGRLFNMLRALYPLVMARMYKRRGRVGRKVAVFLKRHEDLWLSFFDLAGWRAVETNEIDLEVFEGLYRDIEGIKEEIGGVMDRLKDLPQWVREAVAPRVGLGLLEIDDVRRFIERVRGMFDMYRGIPKAVARGAVARTKFQRDLRSALRGHRDSSIAALAIRGSHKPTLKNEVRRHLQILLSRGIAPADYSYNYIIVVRRKTEKGGFWLSTMDNDPEDVLRSLEARPAIVFITREKIESLGFEERDIGWGLTIAEKTG